MQSCPFFMGGKMFFLKLYYKFLEWEWYTNANVMRLFIHCMLKANRQTKKWQGITIERGSFITSYNLLAVELNLSPQQIRTALDKLESTGEITRRITRNQQGSNTMITVKNYNEYQPSNTQDNTQITLKQHSNNTQITTTKECNNVYNDKNVISINAEKIKKTDPYINPLINKFKELHEKIIGKRVYLNNAECNKLTELAADVEDFSSTLPTVLKKLKSLKFDGIGYKPNASWLLKDNHYTEILNGAYDVENYSYKTALQRKQEVIDSLGG